MDKDDFYSGISELVASLYAEQGQSVHIVKGLIALEVLIDDRPVRQVAVLDIGVEVLPWEIAGFAKALEVRAETELLGSMFGREDGEDHDHD